MATTKNLCAQIPIDLHERVSEERERLGQTTSEYIANLIQDYYNMMENQKGGIQMIEKGRTMAFQIPEELFQRIKEHLDRESLRLGRKYTQREFVLGLIEEALTAAENTCQPQEDTEDTQQPQGDGEDAQQPQEDGEDTYQPQEDTEDTCQSDEDGITETAE